MPTLHLNDLNHTFKLHGNNGRRSLELEKIILNQGAGSSLQLQVLDEKDITLYTHDLQAESLQPEILIHRKFVFYDHLTVQIVSSQPDTPFEAEVFYQ